MKSILWHFVFYSGRISIVKTFASYVLTGLNIKLANPQTSQQVNYKPTPNRTLLNEKTNLEKLDCVLVLKFGNPILYKIKHKGIYYTVDKQGFMYPTKNGLGKFYIFGVACRNTFFKVKMDLKTLNCYLVEKSIVDSS